MEQGYAISVCILIQNILSVSTEQKHWYISILWCKRKGEFILIESQKESIKVTFVVYQKKKKNEKVAFVKLK